MCYKCSILFSLIIVFDVTLVSANTRFLNFLHGGGNRINANNNNNNNIQFKNVYETEFNLCYFPWKYMSKCSSIVPMSLNSVYIIKLSFPLNKGIKKVNKYQHVIYDKNCQKQGNNSSKKVSKKRSWPELKEDEIDFVRYHSFDTINKYLNSLQWKYPHLVTMQTLGKSFEKRDLNLIKISVGDIGIKAVILIVGGMNANEWISSATVLYAIQQLAENQVNAHLLAKADWYFIPIMNPDGFVYSHEKDHEWKRTRSHQTESDECIGVDLNQNFDSNCNYSSISNRSCSGNESFTEPETLAIMDFIKKQFAIHLFININNYGQSIDYPINSSINYINDANDLHFVAEKVSYAIHKYGGHKYGVKAFNSCGIEQWAKTSRIKYSYNIKLPAGEKLDSMSQIPESKILPIAQEIFVAFKQLQQILASIYGITYDLIVDADNKNGSRRIDKLFARTGLLP